MLEFRHIHLEFDKVLLEDETMILKPGITAVIGANGTGKSTLLYVLSRFIENKELEIYWKGEPLDISKEGWKKRYIGLVMQEPRFLDVKTIYDLFKITLATIKRTITVLDVREWLEKMRIQHGPYDALENLSGGEKQRLALALALVKRPRILLLDEPTSALDAKDKQLFLEILKDEVYKQGLICCMVSHDKDVISQADCLYEIKDQHLFCIKDHRNLQRKKRIILKKVKKNVPLLYIRKRKLSLSDYIPLLTIILSTLLMVGVNTYLNHTIREYQGINTLYDRNQVLLFMEDMESIDTRLLKPFSKDMVDLLRDKQDVSTISPYYHFYIGDLRVQIDHREVDCVNHHYENQPIYIEIGDYKKQIILENPEVFDDQQNRPCVYLSNKHLESEKLLITGLDIRLKYESRVQAFSQHLKELNPNFKVVSQVDLMTNAKNNIHTLTQIKIIVNSGILLLNLGLGILYALHQLPSYQYLWAQLSIMGLSKRNMKKVHIYQNMMMISIALLFVLLIHGSWMIGAFIFVLPLVQILVLQLKLWQFDSLHYLRDANKKYF